MLKKTVVVVDRIAMPALGWAITAMAGMTGYYRTKFQVFYALELRDWQREAALKPAAGALPEDAAMNRRGHAIADGIAPRGAGAGRSGALRCPMAEVR